MHDDVQLFGNLETERLILRPLTYNDTDFVFNHFGDEQVSQYLVDFDPILTRIEAKEIIEFYFNPLEANCNRWGIELKENDALIGTCGFHVWDKRNKKIEVGCDLSLPYRKKGYMKEALQAAITHIYEKADIHRIEANIHIENTDSYNLLRRLGFQPDGVMRQKYHYQGIFYDQYCMSILKPEWQFLQKIG